MSCSNSSIWRAPSAASRDALGRAAAQARHRHGPDARPTAAVHGRALHRAGSAEPRQPVGAHPRAARRARHHAVPYHPLPRRGRCAVRPHPGHRPRPHRRRRHTRRAEAPRLRRSRAGGHGRAEAGQRDRRTHRGRHRTVHGRAHGPLPRARWRERPAGAAARARRRGHRDDVGGGPPPEPRRRVPDAHRPHVARRGAGSRRHDHASSRSGWSSSGRCASRCATRCG